MTEQSLTRLTTATSQLRLLYIEDNADARLNTLEIFEEFFSDVTIAKNGKEGLTRFEEGDHDLIITDIKMPLMNGLEMIAKIREQDADIPILILSAYDETDYFLETIRLGVEGYLLKPIEMDQFIDLLLRVTRHIQNRRENEEYKKNLEQKVLEKTKRLRHVYSHDILTGLPNSVKLDEALRSRQYHHLILLDISDFKLIAKEYGRHFANETLRAVAHDLSFHADEQTPLFKVEADRFIFLTSEDQKEKIHTFCDRIRDYFDEMNITVIESELNIDFYIGVSKISLQGNPIIDAEYALEEAKRRARGQCFFYLPDERQRHDELEMIKWLKISKDMIIDELIEPFFQPIKEIKSGKVVSYEVLARGIHDKRLILPEHFLIPAEHLNLSSHITRTIIKKSFAFFQDNEVSFSINISERDLLEEYLSDHLRLMFEEYSIDPGRLTLELVEDIGTRKNSELIIERIKALQGLGLKIAIDDFGVEHSNFSRLLEIDIDVIKIDGIFIKTIDHDEKGRQIVKAMVSLAKTLGVKTVAEYVESEAIYDVVKACGIDFAQGYHIGRPHHTLLEDR